jgi:hypothetical protein
MNIKIVSDGTWYGTKIIDSDTGETINNVIKVEWSLSVEKKIADCVLTLIDESFEYVGNTEIINDPH